MYCKITQQVKIDEDEILVKELRGKSKINLNVQGLLVSSIRITGISDFLVQDGTQIKVVHKCITAAIQTMDL